MLTMRRTVLLGVRMCTGCRAPNKIGPTVTPSPAIVIRQLNAIIQRNANDGVASYLLAQAYRMKSAYPQSIEAARNAIRLAPGNPEPHFWLAESLRLSGAFEKSKTEYAEYLRLSDFDSKLSGKLNYYVLADVATLVREKNHELDIQADPGLPMT